MKKKKKKKKQKKIMKKQKKKKKKKKKKTLPLPGHLLRSQLRCFFFFFTLVTGPRRSLSLRLSVTRVYEP